MLTVHHLGISQSDRIVWLCEELELPYEFVRYERDPDTNLVPPAYRALHPAWSAPVITDGDVTLAESGAIIEYIIARHGRGRLSVGADDPHFAEYLFWMHFANGSMMGAGILNFCLGLVNVDPAANATVNGLKQRYDRGFAIAEAQLAGSDYLAGPRFSAADIIMLFPLTTMRLFTPYGIDGYPNLKRYLARIGERPAFRRAMEKIAPDPAAPLN